MDESKWVFRTFVTYDDTNLLNLEIYETEEHEQTNNPPYKRIHTFDELISLFEQFH
ncbi:hypothetical protein [Bacillus solimangrovi]|uniref:hypothetical protein n=1 Tax=Bacillus solimangrovi TaxID=1305675 RepID=UPI001586E291|nr:hypothetical protein [Bacillus solimangrovi]